MAENGQGKKKSEVNTLKSLTDFRAFVTYTQTALLQTIYLQADSIRFNRKVITGLGVFCLILVIALVLVARKPTPEPKYIVVDAQGRMQEVKLLSEYSVNTTEIRTWGETCIIDAVQLSFVNPLRRINTILNKCFTQEGKLAYQDWLIKGASENTIDLAKGTAVRADSEIGQVVSRKISIQASPKAPGRLREIDPILNSEGHVVKRWELTIPLLLRKEEKGESAGTSGAVAQVTLVRTNDSAFDKGVAINSFVIAKQR